MTTIRPSRIRKRILREHQALQAALDQLEVLLTGVVGGTQSAAVSALEHARALCVDLRAHIDHEDELLLPVLRAADAWGNVRADQLAQHHEQQRHAFGEQSLAGLRPEEPTAMVAWLRDLIAALRSDIAHEESELLGAELLRDDVFGIDVEDG
jgi:hypothetical protein